MKATCRVRQTREATASHVESHASQREIHLRVARAYLSCPLARAFAVKPVIPIPYVVRFKKVNFCCSPIEVNMQTGKNAAASVKETASNVAASAKAGMEKTKATLEEKVGGGGGAAAAAPAPFFTYLDLAEKLTARNPTQKEIAEGRKEERKNRAEMEKLEARELNAAEKEAARAQHAGVHTSTQPHPHEQVTSGVARSHPIGTNTGTTTARNP
ncbi:hypothetical protein ACLOJK_017459 [Asimina triloba]